MGQAKGQRCARSEPLDDLPRVEILFVRVRAHRVQVVLIGVGFGQELAVAGEGFQARELVFFDAMRGSDVALIGVSGGRDAHVLAVGAGRGTDFLELAAVVGLHTRLRSETPSRAERCWMGAAKTALAEALRC